MHLGLMVFSLAWEKVYNMFKETPDIFKDGFPRETSGKDQYFSIDRSIPNVRFISVKFTQCWLMKALLIGLTLEAI